MSQLGLGCAKTKFDLVVMPIIRVGLRLGRSPIHVRSTPDSDRKFKALLFVAMCQELP